MTPEEQKIINDRLDRLEGKSLQVNLQPTERENLKNNLFEVFQDIIPIDAIKNYLKVIWKEKTFFIPTGSQIVYSGFVNGDGSASTHFPDGWTSGVSSSHYTVTHNLGDTNYSVVANAYNATPTNDVVSGVLANIGANSFEIWFVYLNAGVGTVTNTDFNFILTK